MSVIRCSRVSAVFEWSNFQGCTAGKVDILSSTDELASKKTVTWNSHIHLEWSIFMVLKTNDEINIPVSLSLLKSY